ncbi:hypothetical protein FRC12_021956 [Ceratobasidium sp. 428]|nr:hypothetical protein FRC12_021956 [Ceratobasidium sp. 428]
MGGVASKIKRSVQKRFQNQSLRTLNNPKPSTASSHVEPPSIPAIANTNSQLASEQATHKLPLFAAPEPQPEPNDATQPPVASVAPALPTGQGPTHDAWLGLEALARLIREGSGSFSPLKEVIGGILEAVDTFELAAQNRKDFQKLRNELNALFNDLSGHLDSSTPPTMTSSIVNLAQ